MTSDDNTVKLDIKLILAFVITIGTQTATVAWFMGGQENRLAQVEKVLDSRLQDADRLTKLEVQLLNIRESLARIEKNIR